MKCLIAIVCITTALAGCSKFSQNSSDNNDSPNTVIGSMPIIGSFSPIGGRCSKHKDWLIFTPESLSMHYRSKTPVQQDGAVRIENIKAGNAIRISMNLKKDKKFAAKGAESGTWALTLKDISDGEFTMIGEEVVVNFKSGKKLEYDASDFGEVPRKYYRCDL